MAKTILITGGLGYIGSHTAVVFLQAGYEVVIIDNLSNSTRDIQSQIETITWMSCTLYVGDIADDALLNQIFTTHSIACVIHFAAKKAVGESCAMPFDYYDTNIGGTLTLCRAMIRHGVAQIVFSSSATVYDASKSPAPFAEEALLGTTNPYGTTKLVVEYILRDLATYQWLHATCLRYFNPIGAHPSGLIGENPRGIPNNLTPYIFAVAKGELPHLAVYGNDYETPDGTCIRDYIHVIDLASAHLAAYTHGTKVAWKWCYECVNLGTGNGKSVLEMIAAVETVTGRAIPYVIAPRRAWDIAISLADVSKADTLWWWKATYSVEQAIMDGRRFIQWHEQPWK